MAGAKIESGLPDIDGFERAYLRNFSARIYELEKTAVDIRVYMTDAAGKIVFDSKGYAEIGEDYSQWRDVR